MRSTTGVRTQHTTSRRYLHSLKSAHRCPPLLGLLRIRHQVPCAGSTLNTSGILGRVVVPMLSNRPRIPVCLFQWNGVVPGATAVCHCGSDPLFAVSSDCEKPASSASIEREEKCGWSEFTQQTCDEWVALRGWSATDGRWKSWSFQPSEVLQRLTRWCR